MAVMGQLRCLGRSHMHAHKSSHDGRMRMPISLYRIGSRNEVAGRVPTAKMYSGSEYMYITCVGVYSTVKLPLNVVIAFVTMLLTTGSVMVSG